MRFLRRLHRDERGQASMELTGMVLYILLAAFAVWQILLVAWTVNEASNAARTGSRIIARDGDPKRAATHALTTPLRDRARVTVTGDRVTVRVRVPLVFPGLGTDRLTVSKQAELPS